VYTRTAVWLHWILAVGIIGMLILGFCMLRVPPNTPARGTLLNLHKSLGMVLLAIILLRTAWRLAHSPPPFPDAMPHWQRMTAASVHIALYALLLAQPLTGYLTSAFGIFGVRVFGWELPKVFTANAAARTAFAGIHHVGAALILALVVVHILAAIRNWYFSPSLRGRMRIGTSAVQ